MNAERLQRLRVLDGRFVLERAIESDFARVDWLALVRGPDGGAMMRRSDDTEVSWSALWNGDEAHPPEATGMLSAILTPLAADRVPVWTAASIDGDLILVPTSRLTEAVACLRLAGHEVVT
ncbi:conserved hypothetical protein [Nostocoides australiense Ben110]|uniref:CASTOR ACT domain-containing protein n=1 Tax=Nostocoides australiense Ben110 TaxID=1193182 RepID=W6K0F8_9MICO|nr:ACT domain-containing protein [Tetrasphaera australiensis]CCH74932.1 conserved hypothetical protein [Tetrasphaera australiensis Ben110]